MGICCWWVVVVGLDTLSHPFLIDESVECLYKLLVAACCRSNHYSFPPGIQRIDILLSFACQYFAVLTSDSVGGCYSTCRRQVWSLTTLSWESLRLGLGRDGTPSVIFRTLSPICILSVVKHYFVSSAVPWLFVLYKLYYWLVGVVLYIFSIVVADYRDLL